MTNRTRDIVAALVVLLIPLPIYILRLDRTVGMMVDDAWYILLAKALAQGDGYRLINSPVPGILPMYPPGFPALLSLVFQVDPIFPANLWLLKCVSVGAMLGVALLTYSYLHRDRELPRHLAACAAIATATTPALVFLATSTVMSECVFTLAQLGAVVVAHRAVAASGERTWGLIVAAALLASMAVLIRSTGLGVIAAAGLCFLRQRRWKTTAEFGAVVLACLIPWAIYTRAHAPTAMEQEAHRGSIVYGYTDQFWMRRAGAAATGRIAAGELPERVSTNVVDVFARGVGAILTPSLLRGPDESGEEVVSLGGRVGFTLVGLGGSPVNMAISLMLASIVSFGYVRTVRQRMTVAEILVPISLAITVLWPWWTFRFVVPLAPFLFFYFVKGLRPSAVPRLARVALLCIIGLNLYDHATYVFQARSNPNRIDWLVRSQEVSKTMDWMRAHVPKDAVVATTNPALVYLLAGNKTITWDTPADSWSLWRNRGAQYVACFTSMDVPDTALGPYTLLYESSSDASTRAWVVGLQ